MKGPVKEGKPTGQAFLCTGGPSGVRMPISPSRLAMKGLEQVVQGLAFEVIEGPIPFDGFLPLQFMPLHRFKVSEAGVWMSR